MRKEDIDNRRARAVRYLQGYETDAKVAKLVAQDSLDLCDALEKAERERDEAQEALVSTLEMSRNYLEERDAALAARKDSDDSH